MEQLDGKKQKTLKYNQGSLDNNSRDKGEEGLHAITNALSLAFGIDPTEISYDEGTMWEHV